MMLGRIIAGVCALFLGRRLFWLFVGIVGFVVGMDVAIRMEWGAPETVMLTTALIAGLVGAALAIVLRGFMISVAGFVAGSYLGAQVFTAMVDYPGRTVWFALLIGGLAGALMLNALFDWTLIILSSLVGASIITEAFYVHPQAAPLPFLVLLVVGVAVQANMRRGRRPARRA